MAFQGASRMSKQEQAIRGLPANPSKHIYWIVYNQDMVEYTSKLIEELRGADFSKHVTVVPKGGSSNKRSTGHVYFDPTLLDLIGNGG